MPDAAERLADVVEQDRAVLAEGFPPGPRLGEESLVAFGLLLSLRVLVLFLISGLLFKYSEACARGLGRVRRSTQSEGNRMAASQLGRGLARAKTIRGVHGAATARGRASGTVGGGGPQRLGGFDDRRSKLGGADNRGCRGVGRSGAGRPSGAGQSRGQRLQGRARGRRSAPIAFRPAAGPRTALCPVDAA
jgi:hypothetical protein